MRKLVKFILIPLSVLFTILFIGRLVGIYNFFHIPTDSMYPNLPAGTHIFTTSLVDPKTNDPVVYLFKDGTPYIQRLIGMPGDTIELRDGYAFVNNKAIDKHTNLAFRYIIKKEDYQADKYQNYFEGIEALALNFENPSFQYVAVILPESTAKELEKEIQVRKAPVMDHFIQNNMPKFYKYRENSNNFGPIIVPQDSIFVLGDSRHNALDSRFTGFVPLGQLQSTAIYKY